jgi:hypothetical protein
MADIYKVTEVLSKVFQILCMIAAIATLVGGILLIVAEDPGQYIGPDDRLVNVCGMAIYIYEPFADKAADAIGASLIVSAVLLGLLTMIFRNVNLIVCTSKGKTWFSKGETPFQDDVVRMVREIGIFMIFMYVVGLVGTSIVGLICDNVETSTTMVMLVMGIIVICLSKIFEYGKGLQESEDGLI